MNIYQKTMLCLYPQIDGLVEDSIAHIRKRAMFSYASRQPAHQIVDEIIEEILIKDKLFALKERMEKVLRDLTEEEMFLLEFKYFKRQSVLNGRFAKFTLDCCERSYYRKQLRLESKLNERFLLCGMDKAWFFGFFENVQPVMKTYRCILKREADEREYGKRKEAIEPYLSVRA